MDKEILAVLKEIRDLQRESIESNRKYTEIQQQNTKKFLRTTIILIISFLVIGLFISGTISFK